MSSNNKILPFHWWVISCTEGLFIFYCFDFRSSGVEEVSTVIAYSNIFPVFKRRTDFNKVINYSIESGQLLFKEIVNSREFIYNLDNKELLFIFNDSPGKNRILLFGKDNLYLNEYSFILFQGNVKSLLYGKYPSFDFDKASIIINRLFSGLDNYGEK